MIPVSPSVRCPENLGFPGFSVVLEIKVAICAFSISNVKCAVSLLSCRIKKNAILQSLRDLQAWSLQGGKCYRHYDVAVLIKEHTNEKGSDYS